MTWGIERLNNSEQRYRDIKKYNEWLIILESDGKKSGLKY